jgi:2-polyprenyl-6-hydroxyphenyl methylase/3-demethylubiquinone-9 3-methyltransferase
MPVNNEIYSTEASGWWDENHFLHLLKTGMNPARFGYFRDVLVNQLSLDPPSLAVLDVGCGGGILAEEFARLGCHVTGIDPSAGSLQTAHLHAVRQGLAVGYCQAPGETLPFGSSRFDVAVCCDVLEHVADYANLLQELARSLKPGGLLFYDTINRTEQSRMENILVAQEFPLTRFFPHNTHVWEKFIQPEELLKAFQPVGLQGQGMTGVHSGLPDLQVAALLVRRKLGLVSFAELGRRLKFETGGSLEASYLGWAVKMS